MKWSTELTRCDSLSRTLATQTSLVSDVLVPRSISLRYFHSNKDCWNIRLLLSNIPIAALSLLYVSRCTSTTMLWMITHAFMTFAMSCRYYVRQPCHSMWNPVTNAPNAHSTSFLTTSCTAANRLSSFFSSPVMAFAKMRQFE